MLPLESEPAVSFGCDATGQQTLISTQQGWPRVLVIANTTDSTAQTGTSMACYL